MPRKLFFGIEPQVKLVLGLCRHNPQARSERGSVGSKEKEIGINNRGFLTIFYLN